MVKLTFDEERVPLREHKDGTVYVGNTKVALEGVILRTAGAARPRKFKGLSTLSAWGTCIQ